MLDDDEQLAVLDTVLEVAPGLPVMVGLAGVHQGDLMRRLKAFTTRPIAGVMVPAPYYMRPSQPGIADHFTRLAAHPNIQALKDCGGSPDKTQALIADGGLAVLSGEDAAVFSALCMGGHGAIAASAQVRPDLFVAMYRAVQEQRLADARAIFHALAPLVRTLFDEPNPGGVKAALHHQGWVDNELRPPMSAVSQATQARLAKHLETLASAPC